MYCPFNILAKGSVGSHPIVAGNILGKWTLLAVMFGSKTQKDCSQE